MSTSKSGMKDFFKQKKKSGITKPKQMAKAKSSSSGAKKSSTPEHSATYSSDITQPAALISHGSPDLKDDYDKYEEILRQFDMNMAYGPCVGISRLDRCKRAKALGMNPPEEVEQLLKSGKGGAESLWDCRV